ASVEDPRIADTARGCCPHSAFGCCSDAICFHRRLSCKEMQSDEEIIAMRCIQTALHGEADTNRTSIDHFACCDVFLHDLTDEQNICFHACE
ncbi:hypothetical protein PMAYCL1PPCAC_31697, partial [Pristionchus mayeri]